MRFHTKGFTSLLMGCCFLVASLSGIMMYVTPKGRVANWMNWTMFGLGKEEWSAVHINACLLLLIVGVLHWFLNWTIFWTYIRKRAGGLNLKVEMAVALVCTAVVVTGTLLEVPPFSTVMAWNDNIKAYWAQQAPTGPAPHAEDFSVQRFAHAVGLSSDEVASALQEEGFVVASPHITISSLASQKGIAPSDVYSAVKSHFPEAGSADRTWPGQGQRQGQGGGRGAGRRRAIQNRVRQ